MATYLIRCAESGREQQARLGKLRRDLANVIEARLVGARIEVAPGRVIVESDVDGALDVLASLPGVGSVAACERVAFDEIETAVLAIARRALDASASFAVRVRRGGEKSGASANESRPQIARRLADVISRATSARIDLGKPDVEIGIELRGDEAFVFGREVDGIDRTGPMATPGDGEPRFVADQMLGRLAARLRLIGYDTLTVFDIADSEVTRIAAADGRILLTKDGPLAATRAVPVHRVQAAGAREQLAEVIAAFGLTPDPARYFTRCTLCNAVVEAVDETEIEDALPARVRRQELAFFRCPGCAQVYWRGAHVERVLAELALKETETAP